MLNVHVGITSIEMLIYAVEEKVPFYIFNVGLQKFSKHGNSVETVTSNFIMTMFD